MSIIDSSLFYSFISCRKGQYFQNLSHTVDVTPFFWNSFEDIKEIYEHIIVQGGSGWTYPWNTNPISPQAGVHEVVEPFVTFEEAKNEIDRLLSQNKHIFIYIRNRFVPHMVLTGSELEGTHSITLISHDAGEDIYRVWDYPFDKEYELHIIQEACNHSTIKEFSYITIDKNEYDRFQQNTKNDFKQWMLNSDGNFHYYERLRKVMSDSCPAAKTLISFFGVVALSRKMLSQYIEKEEYSRIHFERLLRISNLAEIIKQKLVRLSVSENYKIEKILTNIEELQKMEHEFLEEFKRELATGIETDYKSIKPAAPAQINVKHLTDTSAWLTWDNSRGEIEMLKYNIYVDHTFYGTCAADNIIIGNLSPDSVYSISIESVNKWNQSSNERASVQVKTTPLLEEGNLSRYKPVYASSEENDLFVAANTVDQQGATRWSSLHNDSEWIYVDLGRVKKFSCVLLNWENACAAEYKLQTSNDGEKWNDIYHNQNGKAGIIEINLAEASARYIKVLGIRRASVYGYSLWEISVF
ncbi:discoidin domain-containing protein [Paenibacillus solani]|uniref:discoidin domain-containing protein n=1 Tax=Paenibacillus solani TaxID=1705565 RepID=UPI003D29A5BF